MGFSATKAPVHNKADLAKKIEVNLNSKIVEVAAWLDMVNNVKCTGPYFAGWCRPVEQLRLQQRAVDPARPRN